MHRFLPLCLLLLAAAAAPETPAPPPPSAPPSAPASASAPAPVPASASAPPPSPAPGVPSPSAPASAPVPPAVAKLPPTVALQHVAPEEALPVLGHAVIGPDGKQIARLINILIDADGKPVAAVLDFGGFMGVGARKIAVNWSTLRFTPANIDVQITLTMTPEQIKAAPQYRDPDKPAQVVVPAEVTSKPGPP